MQSKYHEANTNNLSSIISVSLDSLIIRVIYSPFRKMILSDYPVLKKNVFSINKFLKGGYYGI